MPKRNAEARSELKFQTIGDQIEATSSSSKLAKSVCLNLGVVQIEFWVQKLNFSRQARGDFLGVTKSLVTLDSNGLRSPF